jgi:hypothetical protein
VFAFSKLQDIEDILKKQWSALFQKLLHETRSRAIETRRIDNLTDQFEDLKTAILTSIGTSNEKEVARGVVRFRRLMDFIRGLGLKDMNFILHGRKSWDDLLNYVDIVKVVNIEDLPDEFRYVNMKRGVGPRARMYLIKEDGTYYELRTSTDFFHSMSLEWEAFMDLPEDTREIIVDALSEMRIGPGPIRYIREPFEHLFESCTSKQRLIFEEEIEDTES